MIKQHQFGGIKPADCDCPTCQPDRNRHLLLLALSEHEVKASAGDEEQAEVVN